MFLTFYVDVKVLGMLNEVRIFELRIIYSNSSKTIDKIHFRTTLKKWKEN